MTQRYFHWLKQRPWFLLPMLGAIPLVGFVATSQNPPASLSTGESTPAPTSSPVALVPSPSLQVTPSPQPTPTASTKPTPQPKPQASKPPAPVAAKPKTAAKKPDPRLVKDLALISADSLVEMRVAIAQGVPSLAIGSSAGADLFDGQGNHLRQLPAQARYSLQTDGANLYLDSVKLPAAVWFDSGNQGPLYVGNRAYRGRFLLVAQNGRIWAVNYINMRYYLASVVGSEMPPSWSMEALKAQAVAARSYALVYYLRPVSSLYHMGSDEYYQVYKGIEGEANTSHQAVSSTAGEFVSHKGGVVESLYAASDDIVMEAFQGRGMSQTGAYELAQQGYSYRQILANYYPGTSVARLEMDTE